MEADELFEITGIERIPLDNIMPYTDPHAVFVVNPDLDSTNYPIVPIQCTQTQWYFLWWIYRLRTFPQYMALYPFDAFLVDYLGEIYEDYYSRQKRNNS
jgi:hypothetical protein